MQKLLTLLIVLAIVSTQPAFSQHTIKGEKSRITKVATIRLTDLP